MDRLRNPDFLIKLIVFIAACEALKLSVLVMRAVAHWVEA